ncbi:MAG: DUF11 domain-containing protein [Clostridia bacterium]|nr:DUF11 domain-containing protein [Clostridia bacterium]
MATILNNSATLTYNSGAETGSAASNVVTTSLLDSASVSVEKYSANSNWRPGENITYFVTVTNTGTQPLNDIVLTDDLGGDTAPLVYVTGSARVIDGNDVTAVTPTDTSPLTISLEDALEPDESITVLYVARLNTAIDDDVDSITNTVEVQAVGDGCGFANAGDESSVTLPRADFALVEIVKAVDKAVVSCGDTLTYTFTIENSGNIPATDVVITDTLPEGFTVTSVTSVTDGVTTVYSPEDYSIDENNTLVLPTSDLTITVPARTEAGNGITVVTVTGAVTA